MLEYGFERASVNTIAVDLPALRVVGGDKKFVSLSLESDMQLSSFCDLSDFEVELYIKQFEYAPIKIGEPVGKVRVILDGKTVLTGNIVSDENVLCITEEQVDKPSVKDKIKKLFYNISNKIKGFFEERQTV
jgi:hypothetical protein